MDILLRSFFVTFTSQCIQMADCSKIEHAVIKAKSIVSEQEDMLDSFLKNFIKEYEVDSRGLTIITKPLKHTLYYDDDVSSYWRDIADKEDKKFDIGSAVIAIPLQTLNPNLTFTNENFVHGHLDPGGTVHCWGAYGTVYQTVLKGGPLAAISAMIAFCKFARYGSYLKSTGSPWECKSH